VFLVNSSVGLYTAMRKLIEIPYAECCSTPVGLAN
jgi:hypothetical protein